MFTGEHVPYTNFHDLNLDEMIKKTNDTVNYVNTSIEKQNSKIQEIDNKVDSTYEHIDEEIEEQINDAIEHAVETGLIDSWIQNAQKRRFVILGDSYAEGWTPDGVVTSWPTYLKTYLGAENADYFVGYHGGGGFKWPESDERSVLSILNSIIPNIDNPNTITDIVCGFGRNDIDGALETIISNGNNVVSRIRQAFSNNPRIWLFGIGYDLTAAVQNKLRAVYGQIYINMPVFAFRNMVPIINNPQHFSSDGTHPNAAGQQVLAINISKILNGGELEPKNFSVQLGQRMHVFDIDGNEISGYIYANTQYHKMQVTIPRYVTFNSVNNPYTLATTEVKIGRIAFDDYTGFRNWSRYAGFTPVTVVYQISGDNHFYSADCAINIACDDGTPTDNNVYIWLTLTRLNSAGTNYETLKNVTKIQIKGLSIELPLIGY